MRSTYRYAPLIFLLVMTQTNAGDWPSFRGPNGDGISTEASFPTEWSREKHVKWRTGLPGPGNGSPIVVRRQVYLLCAEDQGRRRLLISYDRLDGTELWRRTVEFPDVEQTHKTNPYCGSTPVSDGERVFAWHGSAGMHSYDFDGNLQWSRDLGRFEHIWGDGSSPILYKNFLIQLCGPGKRTFLVALDKSNGEIVWQTPMEPGGNLGDTGRGVGTWSTPSLINVNGQDQLLVPWHFRAAAYNPLNGQELWSVGGMSSRRGDLVYASPMIGKSVAVIMSGYGGPAFGFKLGGSGDISSQNVLWRTEPAEPEWNAQRIGTGLVVDDNLYLPNADDPGSIECLDIESGKQRWFVRRTSEGPHWGSMVKAGDLLYVTGQNGITRVFKSNPNKFESVAENDLGETSNSTPALSDGQIFLRTWESLYCIGQ